MIRVRKEINPNIGTIWILQKDYKYEIWQEAKDGKDKIEIEPFKGKTRKWSYGIENGIYYTALLSAYSVKEPKILLTVPDLVLSIDPPDEKTNGYTILCGIYSKDEKTTLSLAQRFIKDNKPYVLFAIEPEINKYPLDIDVITLLDNLATNPIIYDTEEKKEEKKKEDKVEVILAPPESGMYAYKENGSIERIAVNIFGELFDYLEVNTKKLLEWFGYPQSTPINEEKLKSIVLERFKNKELISPKDMEEITGMKPNKLEPCKLTLSYKNENVKSVVNLLNKHLNISEERANTIIKNALALASRSGTQIRSEHILEIMNDKEKQQFIRVLKKIAEVIKESDKRIEKTEDIERVLVIANEQEITEFLLFGMLLKLRNDQKKVEIINVS